MKKGIYLNVWLRVEPINADSTRNLLIDDSRQAAMIRDTLTLAEVAWAAQSGLHLQIKWVKPVSDPAVVIAQDQAPLTSVLTYVEGEQDAPSDFAKLTIGLVSAFFEQSASLLNKQGVGFNLQSVFEDTGAVDALSDDV